ncbi:MAG: translocation/assembly module TamB [Bacteroidetes bacterium SW_9_63_38]|nr:MAG: translocation/assembly module TamB [Bacteroidetes bacterium SW_9_63_38]
MSDATSSSDAEPDSPETTSFLRRWGRRTAGLLATLVGIVLLLLGSLLLILQTEFGATTAARWAMAQTNPLPETELTVESVSGSWVQSLSLTSVTLTRPAPRSDTSVTMAHVDTLSARYRLWPLLQGRLHILSATAAGPAVTARQAADSTWDWSRVLPESSPDADTSTGGLAIRVDRVRITDGSFAAAFYTDGRDSTARVQDLVLRARDVTSDTALTVRLDTLGLRAQLPQAPPDLELSTKGALSASGVTLDTLRLDSPRSRVRGHGSVQFAKAPDVPADDVQFRLRATPFALADLTPFAPGLDVDPFETVRLDLTVGGTGRRITAAADARFSTGGTVSVKTTATPTTAPPSDGSPLQYRLNATVQNLTTSLLGPPDSTQNRLNATLSTDLQGASLSSLSGPVRLKITDTRWGPLRTSDLMLTAPLSDGQAAITLDGSLNDTPLNVTGQARPLDEAPRATLVARTPSVNLADWAPEAGLESDLAATTTLDAQGLGTDARAIDLTLQLDSSRIERQPLSGGTLSASIRPTRATVNSSLTLPEGAVAARGSATLDGSERFALDTLRFDDVNPAALIGDTTASRVSGSIQATGRGFSPDAMQLDATASLHDTYYGPYRRSSLETTATLSDGRLTSSTEAALNGSRWQFSLNGTPFADPPTLELADGQFENLDVGTLLADTTQSSRLRGTVEGRLAGTELETMTADLRLRLDSSRVNRQRIETAVLTMRLASAQMNTDLTLRTPNGGTELRVVSRPFEEVPWLRITNGSFTDLNVGALADRPGLTTALSGTVSGEGRGATLDALTLDADLSLSDSRINDASLPAGTLSVSAEAGRAEVDGDVSVAEGRVRLTGHVDALDATPTYALRTEVGRLNVAALAGRDSLTARIDTLTWTLDGRGLDPQTLTASTELAAAQVRVNQFMLNTVHTEGTLQRGQLALDTLSVQSNAVVGSGRGTLAVTDSTAATDFNLRVGITNPAPLKPLFGAESLQLQRGRLETRIYGSSLATQRFDGEFELKGLLYDDVRLAEADLTFNGRRGRSQLLQQLEVEGTVGYLSLPSLSVDRTQFDATYDGTATAVSANVRLDPTHTASLQADVRQRDTDTQVTLQKLGLTLEGNRWSLLQEATITVGDRYLIRGFLLESGDQSITVDGSVDPQGSQSLVTTVESVRLGSVSSLVGLSGLAGTLSGSLVLTGEATSPRLITELSLALRSGDRKVGTLALDASYHDLSLALDARLAHTDGSVLTAEGTLPVDLRLRAPEPALLADRPVRFDLSTDRFPVNWIDPFLDPATVRNPAGTLAADVQIRGTRDNPAFSGTASLANGAADLPPLETRYTDAAATLQLNDDRLTLDKAVLRSSNDGRLRAEGVINFPSLTIGEYDLSLSARNFIAIDTRAFRRALIGGDMTLTGTLTRPALSGRVTVKSADLFYNEVLSDSDVAGSTVRLTEDDKLTLENRFGLRLSAADTTTFDAYDALEMDLNVQLQRNTWLRSKSNPELDVQFMGDLDLSKAPEKDPKVFGSIEVVTGRSTLRQFGQEFEITEGALTFNGDPFTPYLALTAVYEQRARGSQGTEVRITLGLEGRPPDLTPSLSSEPPMDTRSILSYLATGRPADELLSGSGEENGNLATQVALGQASNFVENLAASELGLDVVRVQLRTSGTSYLTVGRYITPRFFVSMEQPITTSNLNQTSQHLPDLMLEYQLTDTLLLRTLNNQQSLQLNLLFEYAY